MTGADELRFIGTLPRFFARMEELFLHLTRHWLRLVEESEDANRSRWPMHPTWQQLREAFGQLAGVPPLDDEKRILVRGARYRGRMRLLRRMGSTSTSPKTTSRTAAGITCPARA